MREICAVFGPTQTVRVDAQKMFVGSGGAVVTAYTLNPKSNTLLTLHKSAICLNYQQGFSKTSNSMREACWCFVETWE